MAVRLNTRTPQPRNPRFTRSFAQPTGASFLRWSLGFVPAVFTVFSVTTQCANAGLWVQGSLAWLQIVESDPLTQSTVPTERRITSSSVGYSFPQGFVFGAQALTSLNSSSSRSAWALGPSGGLLMGGFELTAAYLPLARETRQSSGGVRNVYSGGGFAANLGYTWEVAGPLRLGVHGTYWALNFSKLDGQRLNSPFTITTISPMITMALHF